MDAALERGDNEGAAEFSRRALEIAPGTPDALRVRGLALTQLEEHGQAAEAYRAWIAAEPANPVARNNLANALIAVDDTEGAVAALAQAIQLAPGDLRFRMNRTRLLRSLERLDEAVDELEEMVRIGVRLEREEQDRVPAQFSTRADYENDPPVADQVDFAVLLRAELNFDRDRLDLVARDIDTLLARSDAVAQEWGHALRGRLRERQGDLPGALAAYRKALAPGHAATDVWGAYASLLLRLGLDEEALRALETLASREHDPLRAISALDELIARRPDDPRVRRIRGFAHFEAWHPIAARADLQTAIEGGDSDWGTYRLLGLSLVLFNPNDHPPAQADIPGAIEALTQGVLRSAHVAAGSANDAAKALSWLLDRAFANGPWLAGVAMLTEWGQPGPRTHRRRRRLARRRHRSGPEPLWLSALPQIRPALIAYARAGRLNDARDWRGCAEAWEETQTAFEAAGLPVTAARTSLRIADTRLRLYELDAVATHLEVAERVMFLTARPLTAGLGQETQTPDRTADLEVDYLPVYGIGADEYGNALRQLRIQLYARAGDLTAAAAEIGDGEWLFDDADALWGLAPGVNVSGVTLLAQILRQADQHERAFALLRRVIDAPVESDTPMVWATMATLAVADFETANQCLDAAGRLTGDDPTWRRELLAMRAEIHLRHRSWDEAIELLDAAGEGRLSSPVTQFRVDVLRAEAELGRGNPDSALELARRAILRTEENRLELSRWDLREAWSGTSVHPFSVAIDAAVASGRIGLAFEFAEHSRSRAFLDELVLAGSEVDALVQRIRETRDELEWLERLPPTLTPAEMARLHGIVLRHPPSRRHEPREGPPKIDTDDLHRRVSNASRDLASQLNRIRVETLRRQGVEPVTWRELREAAGAAHVAQYHVLAGRVLLFIGDDEEPAVVDVSMDLDEIDRLMAPARTRGGFDLRRVDLSRLQQVAAPLVAPLASRVPQGAQVCLIPHDRVHAVPLHVLEVGGEPLGIRNRVCYSPSASILVRHLAGDPPPATGRALVVGDPGGDLQHARVEAIIVARQLGVRPALGEQVSKRLVLNTLLDGNSPPALVHVAGHGTLDTGGAGAGIVLGHGHPGDQRWLEDNVLTSQDLFGAKLPAALIVLSCCTTGHGGLRPGDELVGLVRAFLAAGAAAMVVSQWSVDDLSTSLLMRELHRRIMSPRPEDGAATLVDALREATVHVRSMTRDDVASAIHERLEDASRDARTARVLQVDAAALADPAVFKSSRATLATSEDPTLRDAAVEAEARREELLAAARAAGDERHPFMHPHYWAPFVLVGDWRLPARLSRA